MQVHGLDNDENTREGGINEFGRKIMVRNSVEKSLLTIVFFSVAVTSVPVIFTIGLTSEYISGTSNVPLIVPIISFSLSVASVIASMKILKGFWNAVEKKREMGLIR